MNFYAPISGNNRRAVGRAKRGWMAPILGIALFLGCSSPPDAAGDRAPTALVSAFPGQGGLRLTAPAGAGGVTLWRVLSNAGPAGYATQEKSVPTQSGSFTLEVFMAADFSITHVEVSDYSGHRGAEAASRRFTARFVGKGPADAIYVGRDIDAVTGATRSSQAVAASVRRAVRLARENFGSEP